MALYGQTERYFNVSKSESRELMHKIISQEVVFYKCIMLLLQKLICMVNHLKEEILKNPFIIFFNRISIKLNPLFKII
jgi:hypothetical protein